MKRVLLLGASGLIAPHIIPALEKDYDLRLADIKEHPDGRPVQSVDVRDYGQVRAAMEGMDAVMNFTVLRHDDVLSFQVNTIGAWNIMKAAADAGIKKVIHTGPAQTLLLYTMTRTFPSMRRTPLPATTTSSPSTCRTRSSEASPCGMRSTRSATCSRAWRPGRQSRPAKRRSGTSSLSTTTSPWPAARDSNFPRCPATTRPSTCTATTARANTASKRQSASWDTHRRRHGGTGSVGRRSSDATATEPKEVSRAGEVVCWMVLDASSHARSCPGNRWQA